MLTLMTMAGCPSEFGKDGRITMEQELWEACKGPNKDPEKCRECGG